MPLTVARIPTPEERAMELLAAEREVRRALRWAFGKAIVLCAMWMVIGIALIGWSVSTTDEGNGLLAFWGGLFIGNAGILVTLMTTYYKAIEAGWI